MRSVYLAACVSLALVGCQPDSPAPAQDASTATAAATPPASTMDASAIYELTIDDLDGGPVSLAEMRGKALLFVNTASECGYTSQYEGLQKLHETYGPRGLVVAGLPCNQFGGQEPGTAEEIKTFCTTKYGVGFPMFEKVKVNGPERHPLYAILTQAQDGSGKAGDVQWNFEKFLVAADGKRVERFRSAVEPESAELIAAIERALPRS